MIATIIFSFTNNLLLLVFMGTYYCSCYHYVNV